MTATERLVAAHREFLSFVQNRVESREVAEDILQDAFVKHLKHADEIRDDESVVAWFYRVLRNAVIDHYRRRGTEAKVLESWRPEPAASDEEEICGCVTRLLDDLKPEYREALTQIDLGDTGVAEYASQAGISANNASVRVHRARAALRKQVEKACGTCAEHGCLNCTCC